MKNVPNSDAHVDREIGDAALLSKIGRAFDTEMRPLFADWGELAAQHIHDYALLINGQVRGEWETLLEKMLKYIEDIGWSLDTTIPIDRYPQHAAATGLIDTEAEAFYCTVDGEEAVRVLLHELGHLYASELISQDSMRSEIVAEAIGMLVANMNDVDTSERSIPYMREHLLDHKAYSLQNDRAYVIDKTKRLLAQME